ncbi:MAG: nitrate reductase cytochrome c-type subunit [Fibrobacterales bacterium]
MIKNRILCIAVPFLLVFFGCNGGDSTPKLPNSVVEIPKEKIAEAERSIKQFYENRAYAGAPPQINHPISAERFMGKDCMACHETGGYVKEWDKFAMPIPHDALPNCRQCHSPKLDSALFRGSTFQFANAPKRGNRLAPGMPPMIPHDTKLRKNCATCHFGPTGVKEIRSTHEERPNCTACHMPLQ